MDLVWSYSRSQAYLGDNLVSSPSFVERRWRGHIPDSAMDTESAQESDAQQSNLDDTDAEFSYDNDSELVSEEDDDDDEAPAPRVRDRSLSKPNRNVPWTGMSEDGDSSESGGDQYALHHAHSTDPALRRLSQRSYRPPRPSDEFDEGLSDDGQDGSGRSRSRSPKPIDPDATLSSHAPRLYYATPDRAPSRPPRGTSPFQKHSRSRSRIRTPIRASAPHLRDPYRVDERTPLMRVSNLGSSYENALNLSQMSSAVSPELADEDKSTFWQTWFNTVNALIGVGILSMPLVFASCGWLGGTMLFIICGGLTNWSAKLLANIMAMDPTLRTYADVGMFAFGPRARFWIGALFCIELFTVAVALLILFGDSVAALVHGYAAEPDPHLLVWYKVLGFVLALPTLFLSLSLISPISLVGILSILFLAMVLLVDGLAKKEAPGSLWQPAPTSWAPRWSGFGIGFGLLMSGFASHPVIPSLYRDMRNPKEFARMLDWAYAASAALYVMVAALGYLMFGDNVSDEVSSELALTPGMPVVLTTVCVVLMMINPVTKFGLAVRPVQALLENILGLAPEDDQTTPQASYVGSSALPPSASASAGQSGLSGTFADMPPHGTVPPAPLALRHPPRRFFARVPPSVARSILAVLYSSLILLTAIVFPSLERVMAFLGAFLAFTTSILGPFLANMAIHGAQRSAGAIALDCVLLGGTSVLAIFGTVNSLWPVA